MANNANAQELPVLVSPATLAEIVASLPAETRAQLAWSPKRITDCSRSLLTSPAITDELIEKAGSEYLQAIAMVLPAITLLKGDISEVGGVARQRINEDLKRLALAVPRSSMMAAARATATVLVVSQFALQSLRQIDAAELERGLTQFDPSAVKDDLDLLRAMALLVAVFEGVREPSTIPGRVAELARRADVEAESFARRASVERKLAFPWYVETPGLAADVAEFAKWNPKNLPQWRNRNEAGVSDDERGAWEQVKNSIDEARPHRKLFS